MRITVLGLGIKSVHHLTLESVLLLRSAKKVLAYCGPSVISELEAIGVANIEGIKELCDESTGESGEEKYAPIYMKILEVAQTIDDIVVLIPGHPRVGVTLLNWLDARAAENTFSLDVLPGISSFDTMLVDLKRDPLERGSAMIDASRYILFDYEIDSCMDLYFYHVCSIGSHRSQLGDLMKENKYFLLQRKLEKRYPRDHKIVLIGSGETGLEKPLMIETNLENLSQTLSSISFSPTLFVPGKTMEKIDKTVLRLLKIEEKKPFARPT